MLTSRDLIYYALVIQTAPGVGESDYADKMKVYREVLACRVKLMKDLGYQLLRLYAWFFSSVKGFGNILEFFKPNTMWLCLDLPYCAGQLAKGHGGRWCLGGEEERGGSVDMPLFAAM